MVGIFADSCYAGKLTRGLIMEQGTLADLRRLARKKARNVLTSGGLEPVLDGSGNDRHSVFATSLLAELENNDEVLEATRLFLQIRRAVMVNSDQTPEYSDIHRAGHGGGDFLFVPLR